MMVVAIIANNKGLRRGNDWHRPVRLQSQWRLDTSMPYATAQALDDSMIQWFEEGSKTSDNDDDDDEK